MKYLVLFFSIFILVAACNTKRGTIKSDQTKIIACSEILLLEKPIDSLRIDFYNIDSLNIKDKCLEILVNYGGGCGEARFDLYYTNQILESMPPQTVLHLAFDDNDPCRSIVQKKLKFSLEPFKRFADRGGIYFKISGTERSVLYQIPK